MQKRVRQEVDEVSQGCHMSEILAARLPYLEMVLKESARMHPALSYSLPEKTVKPFTNLGGYIVPKGVGCTCSYLLLGCGIVEFLDVLQSKILKVSL